MRRLQRYEEFTNNQVQEEIDWKNLAAAGLATIGSIVGSPKASGQTNEPTKVVQSVGVEKKDLLGRVLTSPPSTKAELIESNRRGKKYLLCHKFVNPTPQKDAELRAKGFVPVWTDTITSTPKWGIQTPQRKSPTVMKTDNDKFFELGGYKLTNEVKERISKQVNDLGGVDSVTIESSTDKTRLTPKLKADLESKGYTGDNKGLSKARSNAIKSFLVELGVKGANIKEVNLADQGKEGGYDPSARYVKLILVEKGSTDGGGTEYFRPAKDFEVYYQRIQVTAKQKRPSTGYGEPIDCEGGKCATYD